MPETKPKTYRHITLRDLDPDGLRKLSDDMKLSLSLDDMQEIQIYYAAHMRREPTDVELEVIAQTWSEHCKHRIFGARIEHTNAVGEVEVVNSRTPASEVLAKNPDGVFLSNGPGDPAALDYIHSEIREIVGKTPIFGICLGHQVLAHAFGGKTFKLKFGHRGGNHPVKDLRTGKIAITSQNHGFAADAGSLPDHVEVTHLNLNDGTVEGMRHRDYPVFSVQYHPEAAPGPNDASYFFEEFANLIDQSR